MSGTKEERALELELDQGITRGLSEEDREANRRTRKRLEAQTRRETNVNPIKKISEYDKGEVLDLVRYVKSALEEGIAGSGVCVPLLSSLQTLGHPLEDYFGLEGQQLIDYTLYECRAVERALSE